MVTWVMFLAMGILIGVALGIYMSRLDDAAKRKQNALTQELQLSQTELAYYKSEVKRHFTTTASLVNDMTESYRAVHEHLSKGAVDLCDTKSDIESISFKDTEMLADKPNIESTMVKQNTVAKDNDLGVPKLEDALFGEVQTESSPSESAIQSVLQPDIQEVQAQEETEIELIIKSDSMAEPNQATAATNRNTVIDSSPALELAEAPSSAGGETKSAEPRVDITESELSEIEQSRINASRMVH